MRLPGRPRLRRTSSATRRRELLRWADELGIAVRYNSADQRHGDRRGDRRRPLLELLDRLLPAVRQGVPQPSLDPRLDGRERVGPDLEHGQRQGRSNAANGRCSRRPTSSTRAAR